MAVATQWNANKPAMGNQISVDIPDIEENFEEIKRILEAITNGTLGVTDSDLYKVDKADTLDLAGGQIAFPAVAVPSADPNTLDDYEEGTWTCALKFGGGDTGMVVGETEQVDRYVKIGKKVWIQGYIVLEDKGTSEGNATIAGLPFASAIDINIFNLYLDLVTFTGQFSALILGIGTTIDLRCVTEAGNVSSLTHANFANTSKIGIAGAYTI